MRILLIGALCCGGCNITTILAKSPYEAYIDSAENYVKRERYADAARCYRESLRINPGSPLNSKIFANLGVCLTGAGEYTEALEAFDVALVREPESTSILNSRARTWLLMNKPENAMTDLDTSLAIDSLQREPLRMRGQLHMLSHNQAKAATDFKSLALNFPDEAWGYAGQAQCLMAGNNYSDAIPLLEKAIEIDDNPDFITSLATAQIETEHLQEAKETLREAIRRHPREASLYIVRAILHTRLYENEAAALDKKMAIDLGADPTAVEALLPSRKSR